MSHTGLVRMHWGVENKEGTYAAWALGVHAARQMRRGRGPSRSLEAGDSMCRSHATVPPRYEPGSSVKGGGGGVAPVLHLRKGMRGKTVGQKSKRVVENMSLPCSVSSMRCRMSLRRQSSLKYATLYGTRAGGQ